MFAIGTAARNSTNSNDARYWKEFYSQYAIKDRQLEDILEFIYELFSDI